MSLPVSGPIPKSAGRPDWRCKLLGHKWRQAHVSTKSMPYGLLVWAYLDDVCVRCSKSEWRMP